MQKTISFTVPIDDASTLNRVADLLYHLAGDLAVPAPAGAHWAPPVAAATPPPPPYVAPVAAAVFGDVTPPVAAATPPPPPPYVALPVAATPPPPSVGVELDSVGLPWDHRIHSSSRGKLAKGGEWKVARGADPALVETVKAELRAVMSVGAPAAAILPPPPPAPIMAPPPPPAPVLPGNGSVVRTFADLMVKITTRGKTQAEVNAAVQSVGLASIALLAARPDMLPTVDAILFPAVG